MTIGETGQRGGRRRVVVTGLGCISPLGLDVATSWSALQDGRSGVTPIRRFDTDGFSVRIAAEVPGNPELQDFSPKEQRRLDRFALYALGAVEEAMRDAGLPHADWRPERAGAAIGSGVGGIGTTIAQHEVLTASGPRRVSPFSVPMIMPNAPAGHAAIRYQLRGPNVCLVSACASGAHSIADGFRSIREGESDVMVAGGAEACLIPDVVAGFARMRALSTRNDEPERASRPFDAGRDGFVLGEGAAILVLESLEHAEARGARIRAELLGQARTADGLHMVEPATGGEGARRCMELALADAGIAPERVGYVNAHGTSTPAGDAAEAHAIRAVFGARAGQVPVSSTKSAVGHLLGASGALEAVFSIRALETGQLPPTLNLDDPDPECALDHVAHKSREAAPEVAISNSFGFGGTNCTLVMGRTGLG